MLFFQTKYKENVVHLLADKEHVSDGLGNEQFIFYILMACAFFFVLSSSMSIFMILKRKSDNKKKISQELLVEKYQTFLSSFLILPVDEAFLGIFKQNELEDRLDHKDISDPYRRKILAREIYALKKDLNGQQESQLKNYFFGLGLQTEVIQMLRSPNWTEKVKALQMISSFKIRECLPEVQKYINSKNRELAIHTIEVRIALDNSLDVLNEIEVELNDWECHKIIDAIKSLNNSISQFQVLKEKLKSHNPFLKKLSKGLVKETPSFVSA